MNLPKFQPEIDPNPHRNHPEGFTCVQCPHRFYAVCVACGEDALRDEATKLCRPCWRAWAFSPAGVPPVYLVPAGIKPGDIKPGRITEVKP